MPAAVRSSTARSSDVLPAVPAGRSVRTARRDEQLSHAELVTVGSLLVAPQLGARVRWLEPEDFTSPDEAQVFTMVRAMTAAGVAVDPVTVDAELHHRSVTPPAGGWAGLLGRAEAAVPVAGSVGFYGRQVLDAAVVGDVAGTGQRLVELGQSRRGGAR